MTLVWISYGVVGKEKNYVDDHYFHRFTCSYALDVDDDKPKEYGSDT